MAVALPDWMNNNRRVIRSTPNPLDKATIINISPLSLNEHKPTIEPGLFILPAGSYDKPSILVVGTSSWWREIDEKQPLLEIPNSAVTVAESVVKDYVQGLMEYSANQMPGLFFIPGALSVKEIQEKHKNRLDEARTKQKRWYEAVVKLADILWSRSNGNPLAINDTMKMAATELGFDKPWMKDFKEAQMSNCPACGALWNPAYPICQGCKTIIDKAAFAKLGLAQVG